MSDGSQYRLTSVGRLIQQRTRKAKQFWNNCLATRKRLNRSSSAATVCDVQTQTTPTIHKRFLHLEEYGGDLVQMPAESCVADSSRDSLVSESEKVKGSRESLCHVYRSEGTNNVPTGTMRGTSPSQRSDCDSEFCKWPQSDNAILAKLSDLQQEVHLIHATLCSLKSGLTESVSSTNPTPLPRASSIPPPPPLPPPFPSSPVFLHSVSLQTLHGRPVMKIQFDEMSTTQDRNKPIVTLEELQKVKLRQVSSTANMKC